MAGKISFPGVGQVKKASAGGMAVKKISSGGAVLWSSSIPRQGVLKSGTQQLSQNNYEKVTGFKIDPEFPDTDLAAAAAANGLLVSGRAAFVAEGTMATSSTANQSRGVQIRGSGTVLATTDGTSATGSRTAKVVVPDGTDVLLELYASAGSSITSYRVLAADTTKLSYRTGGYYEQLTPVTLLQNQITEATLTANAATEWPRVPGSGIFLEAGTYELIWNLYSVGWGVNWSVGCSVGAEQNQVIAGSANSNSWNRPVQTITVPAAQFVMPTVKAGSSSDLTIDAGRLNLFISKI
ncbi:hypothetical protein GS453_14770 [Rhodococcus hoagii]|uniref:Uncharacterized protein n=1 Tax=Rhodococcus hoagii TaxID=43767 RepID=A0AAP2ANC5_RHOHA|nr:hypothetical protein [Prescottella equi]MBM4628077.1 hypothetical protein [Prescottella equi]